MEKEIAKLLNRLKVEYGILWGLCLLLIVLYESDVLPQGIFAGDARAEYMFEVIGILLAVGMIPLSLRLFSLSLTRYVKALPLEQALKSYLRWSEIRLGLLLVPALFNLAIYYWTMNTTGLFCGVMVLFATLFCIPGRSRMLDELDLQNLDKKKE
ncbi:hypothetical protein [uncultured Bacteroides sp.]|uniref:hypothetical protein n=1 Tax=uncultured Bacteroides sp. TaxID=162156 RepID=UPI0026330C67|nr:hypothetical protein [uncultured Bacteroides sp.]